MALEDLRRKWEEFAHQIDGRDAVDIREGSPGLMEEIEKVNALLRNMCEASVTRTTVREAVEEALPRVLHDQIVAVLESQAVAVLESQASDETARMTHRMEDIEKKLQGLNMKLEEHVEQGSDSAVGVEPVVTVDAVLKEVAPRIERELAGLPAIAERLRALEKSVEGLMTRVEVAAEARWEERARRVTVAEGAVPGRVRVAGYDFRLGELEARLRARLEHWEEGQVDERRRLSRLRETLMDHARSLSGNGVSPFWQRLSGVSEGRLKAEMATALDRAVCELDVILARKPGRDAAAIGREATHAGNGSALPAIDRAAHEGIPATNGAA